LKQENVKVHVMPSGIRCLTKTPAGL
jgi:hypothetical protein